MEQNTSISVKQVSDSVKAYAAQCTSCLKWRLVPSRETYEEIREKVKEHPFTCDMARQWKPETSCEAESDVMPGNGMWMMAMDKPSIPRTPKGWQRIIRARSGGGTKFADVCYVSPSNKRLRSIVELNRYLGEHPQFVQNGVTTSQFSFQSPAAFDDKCAAKRRPRSTSRDITSGTESAAKRIAAIVPYEHLHSEHGVPETVVDSQAGTSGNPKLSIAPSVYKDKEPGGGLTS